MTKTLTVRMDSELNKRMNASLDALGLSANAYFVMAAKQLVAQGRVPFDLIVPNEEANEETRRAIVEAEAKALGLIPDDSPRFESAEDAMAFLDS